MGTVLTVAIPVAVYVAGVYVLYSVLTRSRDPFHLLLLAGYGGGAGRAGAARRRGRRRMAVCLVVLALAPWVTVVGYELRGHRHDEAVLAEL